MYDRAGSILFVKRAGGDKFICNLDRCTNVLTGCCLCARICQGGTSGCFKLHHKWLPN